MTQPVSSPATANDNRAAASERPSNERPSNHEVENENLRSPPQDGVAPRPATEPRGGEDSVKSSETMTDPGSGEG